jgi:hypothetical protein
MHVDELNGKYKDRCHGGVIRFMNRWRNREVDEIGAVIHAEAASGAELPKSFHPAQKMSLLLIYH